MDDSLISDPAQATNARKRYAQMPMRPVGVATVRDFCDSWDHLRPLSDLAGDLKDVQRPWMLKAILACVPPGGRICEIGAGEPFVANVLQHWGYDVTIVDPYDGSGQGPTEFDAFTARYPDIRFFREVFRSQMPQFVDACFDAIYSISVLEHLPQSAVPDLCRGLKRYTRKNGCSIHAIDHVLRGPGDAFHHQQLSACAQGMGISTVVLDQVLDGCEADTETYFLSAEGHNRWRGGMKYDDFPMRKVVSVNLFQRFA